MKTREKLNQILLKIIGMTGVVERQHSPFPVFSYQSCFFISGLPLVRGEVTSTSTPLSSEPFGGCENPCGSIPHSPHFIGEINGQ